MNNIVTIVMYHYVRDLQNSRFPRINGLDLVHFKEQILYLLKNYSFISVEQLIDSFKTKNKLPNKAILLTFDDAYIDHFTNVFPILIENKIQGAFFPPVRAIQNNEILDVNKLHFILASTNNKTSIIKEIFSQLDLLRNQYSLNTNQYYYNKLAKPGRFDSVEVIFIKRLLQVELTEILRIKILDYLFDFFVGVDQKIFSKELYMNSDQLKCLIKNGMHVGSHGYGHYFLNSLTYEQQEFEIKYSREFIKSIGGDEDYLSLCFPYGAYNNDTLSLMDKYNYKIGFSTRVDVAICNDNSKFCLPRLDTNDIPFNRNSATNKWYQIG